MFFLFLCHIKFFMFSLSFSFCLILVFDVLYFFSFFILYFLQHSSLLFFTLFLYYIFFFLIIFISFFFFFYPSYFPSFFLLFKFSFICNQYGYRCPCVCRQIQETIFFTKAVSLYTCLYATLQKLGYNLYNFLNSE